MDKRTILAIVLSIAVLLIYQMFFMKPPAPRGPVTERKDSITASTTVGGLKAGEARGRILPQDAGLQQEAGSKKDIRVDTPLYTAVFTNRGGALRSLTLKQYSKALPKDRLYRPPDFFDVFQKKSDAQTEESGQPIELVHVRKGMPLPLTVSFPESSIVVPPEGIYEASADTVDLTKTKTEGRLVYSLTYPGRVRIEKIFTFRPESYTIALETRLYNLSEFPLNENISLGWFQFVDPQQKTDSYGHAGPVSFVANSVERQEVKKLSSAKQLGPGVSWSGFEDKYFIAAMIPQNPSLSSISLGKDDQDLVSVSLVGPRNIIPPGQSGIFNYSLYLGPKDYGILKSQGVGLENAIDFGSWMKWLAMPLLLILKFLYGYVHNYGIAIIILTVLIKILFWPLGNKSYKSMKELQKLQPKLATLREKYKDNRTKMGEETMALYKAHHVNPFGGCLPMIIQIPVFFGLYKALLYAIELRHSPLVWWIQDLSAKDPYYVTPIIMGATMFIQQKMSPPMGDPMQAKMMLWMPVIFTFLFLNFPSGLVVYWLFNNILSIGQQYYINTRAS